MNTSVQPETQGRIHALDAARALALSLGIVLHASLAYMPGPSGWPTADESKSAVAAITFYAIHSFRMLAFFVLAGFFANLLIEAVGFRKFVRNRFARVAVPLFSFWAVVLTAIVGAIVLMVVLKHGAIPKESPPGPSFRPDDFPLTHLWFLWTLLVLYVPFVLVRMAGNRSHVCAALIDRAMRINLILVRWYGLPILAAVLAVTLALHPKWMHWFGIPTPDKSLYGNLAAWVAYGLAFAVGVALERSRSALGQIVAQRWHYLAIGVTSLILSLSIDSVAQAVSIHEPMAKKWASAFLYSLAAWSLCFAFLSQCLRWFREENATIRYLSDASYWVYIVHLPLVMALQAVGWTLDFGWAIEWFLVVAITALLSLGTYHLFVRNTWIGVMLNGRRQRDRMPLSIGELQGR